MSRTITLDVSHSLGRQMASERITTLCNQIRVQYAGQITVTKEIWTDNSLDFAIEAMTRSIFGIVNVEENVVTFIVHLPFLLWPLANKAGTLIERRVQAILQPT